jgi:hypothetical protein
MITAMKTTAPRFQVDPLSRPALPLDSLEYDPEVNLVKAAVSEILSKKVAVLRTSASTVPAVYSFCDSTLTLLV